MGGQLITISIRIWWRETLTDVNVYEFEMYENHSGRYEGAGIMRQAVPDIKLELEWDRIDEAQISA